MPEYPKPERRPKKPKKPIRRISPEMGTAEAAKRETYRIIAANREPHCQGCGIAEYDHSHRITQGRWEWKADEGNIDYYCRDCHHRYESGRMWLLDNGHEVMDWLKQTDTEYYMRKAFQMRDRLIEDEIDADWLPEWVLKILKTL